MGYELGATCKNQTLADRSRIPRGASLRVNELFNRSPKRGTLAAKPAALTEYLLFATVASNVAVQAGRLQLGTHPSKHVGIVSAGLVWHLAWHYSNTGNKVVKDSISTFQSKFTAVYGNTADYYYGEFI